MGYWLMNHIRVSFQRGIPERINKSPLSHTHTHLTQLSVAVLWFAMVTGASQYLQGWSKLVKMEPRERKKRIQRRPHSELAGIFTARVVNSEYAVLVKPRGTDQQESREKRRLCFHVACAWRNLCTCVTTTGILLSTQTYCHTSACLLHACPLS